jgi:hypothetical protein
MLAMQQPEAARHFIVCSFGRASASSFFISIQSYDLLPLSTTISYGRQKSTELAANRPEATTTNPLVLKDGLISANHVHNLMPFLLLSSNFLSLLFPFLHGEVYIVRIDQLTAVYISINLQQHHGHTQYGTNSLSPRDLQA